MAFLLRSCPWTARRGVVIPTPVRADYATRHDLCTTTAVARRRFAVACSPRRDRHGSLSLQRYLRQAELVDRNAVLNIHSDRVNISGVGTGGVGPPGGGALGVLAPGMRTEDVGPGGRHWGYWPWGWAVGVMAPYRSCWWCSPPRGWQWGASGPGMRTEGVCPGGGTGVVGGPLHTLLVVLSAPWVAVGGVSPGDAH